MRCRRDTSDRAPRHQMLKARAPARFRGPLSALAGSDHRARLASVRLRRQWKLTCSAAVSHLKELLELKDDPRTLRHRHPCPDPAAVHARLRGDGDVRELPILMVDADRSTASRDLIARFSACLLQRRRAWPAAPIPSTSFSKPVARDGAKHSCGLRRVDSAAAPAEDPGARRRQRRQLDGARHGYALRCSPTTRRS